MRILSWNIQCGRSCDGTVDLQRTIDYIHEQESTGPLDLVCLQELARNMAQYSAPGPADQLAIMEAAFPDHTAVWGPGFSWPAIGSDASMRREFGNLTLAQPALLDFRVHPLPMPAAPATRQMQRTAIETVIGSRIGDLSVINNHLAFHDPNENLRQVERLCELEQERVGRLDGPGEIVDGCYRQLHLPTARILCGDFNFGLKGKQYRYLLDNGWHDAWKCVYNDEPHAPTCGVFDREQWPEGPHCRDFFWLSENLAQVEMTLGVDTGTSLSDHQPVLIELDL